MVDIKLKDSAEEVKDDIVEEPSKVEQTCGQILDRPIPLTSELIYFAKFLMLFWYDLLIFRDTIKRFCITIAYWHYSLLDLHLT